MFTENTFDYHLELRTWFFFSNHEILNTKAYMMERLT